MLGVPFFSAHRQSGSIGTDVKYTRRVPCDISSHARRNFGPLCTNYHHYRMIDSLREEEGFTLNKYITRWITLSRLTRRKCFLFPIAERSDSTVGGYLQHPTQVQANRGRGEWHRGRATPRSVLSPAVYNKQIKMSDAQG